jgi:hypothetical protein
MEKRKENPEPVQPLLSKFFKLQTPAQVKANMKSGLHMVLGLAL